MSDNKRNRDGRDRSRVDSKDSSEVEYLHSKYPDRKHEEIMEAIKNAGPMRVDVEKYLEERKR